MTSAPIGGTPLALAIARVISSYRASVRTLETRRERDTLRDVLAKKLAADYLREIGVFDDLDEERAA